MPTKQEPDQNPARQPVESENSDVMTLVDLFDQLDRTAFRRALDYRDNFYRPAADPDPIDRR